MKDKIMAPPGGPILPAISNENELTSEQKAEIERINSELRKLDCDHQKNDRKKIIIEAVRNGIHPDLLKGDKVALEDVLSNDQESGIDYARFLLTHGANPNKKISHKDMSIYKDLPILVYVQKPAMADLLFEYGANDSVQQHGRALLSFITLSSKNISMMSWYIDHGVDINRAPDGNTVLHQAVDHRCIDIIKPLMEAGALLSIIRNPNFEYYFIPDINRLNACTVPQIIKDQLENSEKVKDRIKYFDMRTMLTQASHYRRTGLTEDILGFTNLTPELAALIKAYYIQEEPAYEEIAEKPCTPPAARRLRGPSVSDVDWN